jgi:hypothetical protein
MEIGAAIRRRRLFHPVSVLAHGSMRRLAPPGEGLSLASCEVVGQVPKGAGLPGGLPDVVGLAWRMPPPSSVFAPWDVLLASAGAGTLSRCLVRPVISWPGVTPTSLMALRVQDRNWWISAWPVTAIDKPGVRLGDVAAHISRAYQRSRQGRDRSSVLSSRV